ncbi:MAG TPA: SMP-30/gluconolactonase/LRE family protein [Chitinophagaceae bacterium]
MKKITFPLFLLAPLFSGYAQEAKPGTGTIEFISKELSKLINKDAKVEIIAEGFQFTEGPLWLEKEKMLLLSDVPGNTIYKWTEANGKEVYVKPGGYTDTAKRGGFMGPNGLALSQDGKLLVCQHGDRRIAMMDAPLNAPQSKFITVAGQYNGKRLNSPNDLFLTKGGDLYFTDPSYGFERGARDPKKEIAYQGVYKTDKAGMVTLLVDSIEAPNGIAIFPDGKTLLVANSDNRKKMWYAYDIVSNGLLTNGRVFYDVSNEKGAGGCDGFKIDKKGNVFATGPGGIWIFTKAGKLIGKIKINGTSVANCALSPDGKTIYLTATKYLLRVKMR